MSRKPGDIIDQEWNCNKWKFYKNTKAANITSKMLIESPDIPPCTKEIIFNSIYLSEDVSKPVFSMEHCTTTF
jgi:hypothetical protein